MEKLFLNIDNGLLMRASHNRSKLTRAVGKSVKWEEIELNHVVIHFETGDKYYKMVSCIGAMTELQEVK